MRMAAITAWRITGSPARASNLPQMFSKSHFARIVQPHDAARQHQRPGGGVHEQRIRMMQMARPFAVADLVADQLVGGRGIGHAQQRLRQAHQHHALFAGERVFLREGIDAAALFALCADAGDEFARECGSRLLLAMGEPGGGDELFVRRVFVDQKGGRDGSCANRFRSWHAF